MLKFILAWVPLIFVAIANGLFRQYVLTKYFSELAAHQVSTLTAIVFFGLYYWVLFRTWRPDSSSQAIQIGLIWLVFTVLFEFIFGHFIAGHPWSKLLADYNLLKGRIWILVLIWVTVAPYVFFRMMK